MGLVVLVTVDGAVLRAPELFVMDYKCTISYFMCSYNKPLSNLCIFKAVAIISLFFHRKLLHVLFK